MKKNRKKIIFGLTVLTLISVLGKPTLRRIVPVNSSNYCTYETEPDNYDGVQTLGFTSGSTNIVYL